MPIVCREFIQALEVCHTSSWSRLTGACNQQKDDLNKCLRKEVSHLTLFKKVSYNEVFNDRGLHGPHKTVTKLRKPSQRLPKLEKICSGMTPTEFAEGLLEMGSNGAK